MKKLLLVMLGLFVGLFLVACGDVTDNEENTEIVVDHVVTKASLSIEDLGLIDEMIFPRSYSYEVFNVESNEVVNSWHYTYPEDLDSSLLLPTHATMASREIVSSSVEDEMIYTMTSVKLQDGTEAKVLYINDPISLEYVAASVEMGDEITLYTFYY